MTKSFIFFAAGCLMLGGAAMAQNAADYAGGNGTAANPYQIATRAQLEKLVVGAAAAEVHYRLTADIDLGGASWAPIGEGPTPFHGKIHGGGHRLLNIKIASSVAAFIAYMGGNAYIDSLHIVGGRIEGSSFATAFAANVYTGSSPTSATVIHACSNSADIVVPTSTNASYAGGIAGLLTVPATAMTLGAFGEIRVSSCVNTGSVTGAHYCGGIVGLTSFEPMWYANASGTVSVTGSYNGGNVVGNLYTGGILGAALANAKVNVVVSNSYSTGYMATTSAAAGSSVGGIVGDIVVQSTATDLAGTVSISNSYASGELAGVERVGGVIGSTTQPKIFVRNTIAAQHEIDGIAHSTAATRRILGYATTAPTIETSYAYQDMLVAGATVGNDSTAQGTGKTLAELQAQATYAGLTWDFANTWTIREGESFPYFGWQSAPVSVSSTTLTQVQLRVPASTDSVVVHYGSGSTKQHLATIASGLTAAYTFDIPAAVVIAEGDEVLFYFVAYQGQLPASYPAIAKVTNIPSVLAGDGTAQSPYLIGTPEELSSIRGYYTLSGSGGAETHFRLTADIDLSGTEWTPIYSSIKPFNGKLHGAGHRITNLHISSAAPYVGLFGALSNGAYIDSLHIDGGVVETTTGSIAVNCGTIAGVAGFNVAAGDTASIVIKDCSSSATVSTTKIATDNGETTYTGGLVGYLYAEGYGIAVLTIERCANMGTVTGGGLKTGGLVGYLYGYAVGNLVNITACLNLGNVTGAYRYTGAVASAYGQRVGGIVGHAYSRDKFPLIIADCYSYAQVWTEADAEQYAYVGGIAGHLQIPSAASSSTRLAIERCYAGGVVGGNTSTVATSYFRIGGLLGYATRSNAGIDILTSAALQTELHYNGAGHRIYGGAATGNGTLTTNANYGYAYMELVNATGREMATADDSFDGADINLNEAYKASHYSIYGWNFDTVWNIREGESFPYLRYQSAPVVVSSVGNKSLAIDLPAGTTSIEVYKPNIRGNDSLITVAVSPAATTYTLDLTPYSALLASGDVIAIVSRQQGYAVSSIPVQAEVQMDDIQAASVTLDKHDETLAYPAVLTLTATVLPANSGHKTVTWASTNPAVATVAANGLVTSITDGVTSIVVSTDNGLTDTCKIRVTVPVTGITVSPKTPVVQEGATVQLNTVVLPADASNKAIAWHSSDEAIATVDNNGLVTGVSGAYQTGTPVLIIATTVDGGFSDSATVTVAGTTPPTAVAASKLVALTTHPNPVAAGADIIVSLPEGAGDFTLTLYTLTGTKLADYRNQRTVKAPAQSGVYLLVLALPDGRTGVQKVVVK
jgi:uncharacterized protein YjdB